MFRGTKITLLLVLAVTAWTAPLFAGPWDEAAGELAREIAGVTGPVTIALSLRNSSSLAADEVPGIRRGIENSLRAAGVRTTSASAAASEVSVTLSENLEGLLWIASIRQGPDTRVVMRSVARRRAAAARPASSLSLRRTLLWSQARSILDAAVINSDTASAQLLVLDSEKVSLLRLTAGRWELDQALPVTAGHPLPRDVRGRLVPRRDLHPITPDPTGVGTSNLFDVFLPGVTCSTPATLPMALNCRESDDPWPLQAGQEQSAFFGGARNFFTGVLTPGVGKQASTAPFYSAAAVARPNYVLWLFAGTDGRVRALDGVNEVTLNATRDWGSNIAAIKGACGSFVLADAPGADAASDTIRAYDVADREPVAASPPLEFPGSITALWSSAGGEGAVVVVRNSRTNLYEAYAVALTCP